MSEESASLNDAVQGAVEQIEPTSETLPQEASSEAVEQIEELEAKADPTPAEKKKLKSLKIKVFGEEYEEQLPFEIEDDPKVVEYMRKQLQMSKASQRAMQEKSQLEKEIGAFVEELKKNPRKILSDPRVSVDLKKMAAEIIEEEIEQAKKTPEQIEKEKLESRLRELEEERKKEKEEAKRRELDQRTEQQMIRYDQEMTAALQKSDLPKSPYVVKKMADYMLLGLQNKLDLRPEDVVPLVQEEIKNDLKDMFATAPDEVIEALVGKDVFARVRKKNVAKAKNAPVPVKSQVKDTGGSVPKEEQPVEKISARKFFGF